MGGVGWVGGWVGGWLGGWVDRWVDRWVSYGPPQMKNLSFFISGVRLYCSARQEP